jgi:tRNA(Ile2) C34 agmatinyltransferase TiaS
MKCPKCGSPMKDEGPGNWWHCIRCHLWLPFDTKHFLWKGWKREKVK